MVDGICITGVGTLILFHFLTLHLQPPNYYEGETYFFLPPSDATSFWPFHIWIIS